MFGVFFPIRSPLPLPRLCQLLLAARAAPNRPGGSGGAPLAIAVAAQHTVSWWIVTRSKHPEGLSGSISIRYI